jgi:hypothetical protein
LAKTSRFSTCLGLALNRTALAKRSIKDGSSRHFTFVNGTWLNAGTALLDRHGRIIESNEEFAFWAGASDLDSSLLLDVL